MLEGTEGSFVLLKDNGEEYFPVTGWVYETHEDMGIFEVKVKNQRTTLMFSTHAIDGMHFCWPDAIMDYFTLSE